MSLMEQKDITGLRDDDWRRQALADLAERLTHPSDFSCTLSQNAFRRGLIRFSSQLSGSRSGMGQIRIGGCQ